MWDKEVERRVLTFDCLCILMVIRNALSSTRCWLNVQHYYFWKCWSENHSTVNTLDVTSLLGRVAGQTNPCCTVLWWAAQSQAEMPWASFGKLENLGNKSELVKRRVYRAAPAVTSGMCPSQKGTQDPVLYRLNRIKACWDESLKAKIWLLNIGCEGYCTWRQS